MHSGENLSSVSVGITGASGAVYGIWLCEELLRQGHPVNAVVSRNGETILKQECNLTVAQMQKRLKRAGNALTIFDPDDFECALASGSSCDDVIIVCPCSMASLAKIRTGQGDHLVHRMADVGIKEDKRVILVPRETPLSAIHLENMLALARLGVKILPAAPGFYKNPKEINDLVLFIVARILQAAGIRSELRDKLRYCP